MTLIRGVEVRGRQCDVRFRDGRIERLGRLARESNEEVVEGRGGALLPGLYDHHLHLMGLAAAAESIDVRGGLQALRGAPGSGWIRGVGWPDGGDRLSLDAVVADRPVRVQHRGGALWVLNTQAIRLLDVAAAEHPGVEVDTAGFPTGRLWRMDSWLAERIGRTLPDLAAVGRTLARLGITGVTDATPGLDAATCASLADALPQRLQLLGDPGGAGPVKIVVADSSLPTLPELVGMIHAARPRPVAVHCVSAVALVLLVAALDEVGRIPGDRIEHASVVPADLVGRLGVAVVTQPGFIRDRGDDYVRDVDPVDLPDLYRYRSMLTAGTVIVPSSDAPYGPVDPWQIMVAARDRVTPDGAVLGPDETVSAACALDGFLRPLGCLAAPARRVVVGAPADLVLLREPLAEVVARPDAALVRATWIDGARVW
jgi:predicted amidohydrolase YtcJ